jgi:hypothetical protein
VGLFEDEATRGEYRRQVWCHCSPSPGLTSDHIISRGGGVQLPLLPVAGFGIFPS